MQHFALDICPVHVQCKFPVVLPGLNIVLYYSEEQKDNKELNMTERTQKVMLLLMILVSQQRHTHTT